MGRYTSGGVGRDLVAGALAGAAAVWVVDQLNWSLHRQAQSGPVRGRPDPSHAAASRAAGALGVSIDERRTEQAASAIHYAAGAGMGALYGLLRGLSPGVTTARGALFGTLMFVLKDEVGNYVAGLSGHPMDYRLQDHARAAVARSLFGVVTDLGTRLLAPWRDRVVIETGPSIGERLEHGVEQGRHVLERGRDTLYEKARHYLDVGFDYLEQGREFANRLAGQAGLAGLAGAGTAELAGRGRQKAASAYDDLRSRLSDLDVSEFAEHGRKGAKRAVESLRSRLADIDASDIAERGRKHARRFARDVGSRLPDADDLAEVARKGRKHARHYAEDARDQLEDVDMAELAQRGRKHARRFAKDTRANLPDADDAYELAEKGRKHARRYAEEVRSQASEYVGRPLARAWHWLFG